MFFFHIICIVLLLSATFWFLMSFLVAVVAITCKTITFCLKVLSPMIICRSFALFASKVQQSAPLWPIFPQTRHFFCLFSFPRNVLHTFLKCFIICLVRHCLCFFWLPIKKFLTYCRMALLPQRFANVLESSHDGYFTAFININFLGFIPSHWQIGHFVLHCSYILCHQSLPRLHINLPLLIHL